MEKKRKKIVLNFRLPANVQNIDKAIEMLGGKEKIVEIARKLNAAQPLIKATAFSNFSKQKQQTQEIMNLKNIAKFSINQDFVVPLETRVAN